jgi:hypothetical protein
MIALEQWLFTAGINIISIRVGFCFYISNELLSVTVSCTGAHLHNLQVALHNGADFSVLLHVLAESKSKHFTLSNFFEFICNIFNGL